MVNTRFGTDLRLLRNLERQNDRDRGRDLATKLSTETGLVDLDTLHGHDNLKQALLLRFLTQAGELAQLGHARYHDQFGLGGALSAGNRATGQ